MDEFVYSLKYEDGAFLIDSTEGGLHTLDAFFINCSTEEKVLVGRTVYGTGINTILDPFGLPLILDKLKQAGCVISSLKSDGSWTIEYQRKQDDYNPTT